jgi:hypothetical protein
MEIDDLVSHPLVQELVDENESLREEKMLKAKAALIRKRELLINEGVHNDVLYTGEELAKAEFLSNNLFLDHNDEVGSWIGQFTNPQFDEKEKAWYVDLEIVDEDMAKKIDYGAKFGLSATIHFDKEVEKNQDKALNCKIRSASVVIKPAVSATMLNSAMEDSMEPKESPETSDLTEDELNEIEELGDDVLASFIKFRVAYIKKHPGASMTEVKKAWKKEKGGKNAKKKKDKYPLPEDEKEQAAELPDDVKEKLEKLEEYIEKEITELASSIVENEIKLGILEASKKEERVEEIRKLSESERALLANTLAKLEKTEPKEKEPKKQTLSSEESIPEEKTEAKLEKDFMPTKADEGMLMFLETNQRTAGLGGK